MFPFVRPSLSKPLLSLFIVVVCCFEAAQSQSSSALNTLMTSQRRYLLWERHGAQLRLVQSNLFFCFYFYFSSSIFCQCLIILSPPKDLIWAHEEGARQINVDNLYFAVKELSKIYNSSFLRLAQWDFFMFFFCNFRKMYYFLFLRLAQWDWLRMKCTTLQYIHSLKVLCKNMSSISFSIPIFQYIQQCPTGQTCF